MSPTYKNSNLNIIIVIIIHFLNQFSILSSRLHSLLYVKMHAVITRTTQQPVQESRSNAPKYPQKLPRQNIKCKHFFHLDKSLSPKMAAGGIEFFFQIFYKTSHDDIAMKGIGLEAMQPRQQLDNSFSNNNRVRRIENERRRRRRKRSSRTSETSYVCM